MNASRHAAPFAVVVLAHLALLAALLTYRPAREAMVQVIPIVVGMVSPPPAHTPLAKPAPAPPRPILRPRSEPAAPVASRIISAETSQPAATVAPPAAAPPASVPQATAPQATAPQANASAADAASPPSPATQPAAAATGPFTPPRIDPAYLNNPKPEYPGMSLQLGESGRVVLNVRVSAAGTVEQLSVQLSSGHPRLDQAAIKAVRQWKFIPARRGNDAVAAPVLVPINFNPEED